MNAMPPPGRSRTYSFNDPTPDWARMKSMSGLDYFQTIFALEPSRRPNIAILLDFHPVEFAHGKAVFEGYPSEVHYNPIGTVHGGYASTLLDSALGCAVHTTLPAGMGYTTLELKVNFVKAITAATGRVRVEGNVLSSGKRVATAEARLTDPEGRLLAHGSTTCLIFPIP